VEFQLTSSGGTSTTAASQMTSDMAGAQTFATQVMADLSGAVVSLMCVLGDRLDLFKNLAAHGPATSAELADRAGADKRYTHDWLGALASAGYLEYEPESRRFTLPPEHALALAVEGNPMFMGGAYQQIAGLLEALDLLTVAFRNGEGLAQEAYSENVWEGMERISAGWFDHLLVQQWIPMVPEVQAKLEDGAHVADIGCGSGRALIKLAQAFPNSSFVGYDTFEPVLARANATAEAASVTDQVRFEKRDVLEGLPEQYDLITTFDVVHDFVDPVTGLEVIRRSLLPGGTYLLLEINCSDKLEENAGPVGTILYGTSVLYSKPVSLANGGKGQGTLSLPEYKVQELCAKTGFRQVRKLTDTPFNILYEVKP
jgi:SAM-dependent methyltransferase